MILDYTDNDSYKLYSFTFLEVRKSQVITHNEQVQLFVGRHHFNNGVVKSYITKVTRDLTEMECLLAFGCTKEEALRIIGKQYNSMYPHLMNVDVVVIQQDLARLKMKFQIQQSSMFHD